MHQPSLVSSSPITASGFFLRRLRYPGVDERMASSDISFADVLAAAEKKGLTVDTNTVAFALGYAKGLERNSKPSARCVCITGANGFIASHIVEQCLAKGWKVHATVRDPSNPAKIDHLLKMPGAKKLLKIFKSDLIAPGSFDEAFKGVDGIFHTATPVIFGAKDGKASIFTPAIEGTSQILEAAAATDTVKTFVLTSSMSAMSPKPEPKLKSEIHWSDADAQKASGNWYGAAKTVQEKMCIEFVAKMPEHKRFRFAAICPTAVIGPMHQPKINATNGFFLGFVSKASQAKNDSMSFVDVRDCAAVHVAAYLNPSASGRYMCLDESIHWNQISQILSKVYPAFPGMTPCEGTPVRATQNDRTRLNSLGVKIRKAPEIFREGIAHLQQRGLLAASE